MPDEGITNNELARRLEYYVRDLQADLGRIQSDLSLLMPREVFDLHAALLEQKLQALRADLAQAQASIREQEDRDRKRTWAIISALIIPGVLLVVQIYLSTRGAL